MRLLDCTWVIALVCCAAVGEAADGRKADPQAARADRMALRAARSFDANQSRKIEDDEAMALKAAYAKVPGGALAGLDANADGQIDDAEIAALNARLARAKARQPRPFPAATAPPAAPVEETGTGTATLTWRAPTQNSDGTPLKNLSGYVIRYGRNPKALDRRIQLDDPKATTCTVERLPEGTWYFTVSAMTGSGAESMPGPVVSKRITSTDNRSQ